MKKDTCISVNKVNRILFFVFTPLLILLVGKMLFVSYTPDEEYQIVMSYRQALGGKLFYDVYDTIQTSGFLSALLIKIFISITKSTTGLVIYLRVCGLLIKGLIAFYFYKVSKRYVNKNTALLLSLVFFVSFPKMIASLDFSSLQLDFTLLMICLLDSSRIFSEKKETLKEAVCLILSALCLCGCILATACFVMVPVAIVFLIIISKENRARRSLIFWLTCIITGVVYILIIGSQAGFSNMLQTVSGILSGDMTHSSGTNITSNSIIITYAKNLALIAGFLLLDALISYLICFLLKKRDAVFAVFLNFSFLVTLYYWFVKKAGYDGLKLFIPAILLVSLHFFAKSKKAKEKKLTLPLFGIFAGIACFINVLLISNVPLINNLSFLFLSALFGMLLISMFMDDGTKAFLCTLLLAVSFAGTFFTVLSSPCGNTIFSYTHKIEDGPSKGCYVDEYMATVYNKALTDFTENTRPGDNILIVSNCWYNTNLTTLYMTNDVNISHYSVNSTPTYNSSLEDYWNRFPEYYPDIIIVNNSTITTWEWDWINYYIHTSFHYDRQIDTEYLTFFVKEK